MKLRSLVQLFLLTSSCVTVAALPGCAGQPPKTATTSSFDSLRSEGKTSSHADTIGRWALAEMVTPGGDAAKAKDARGRLNEKNLDGEGMYASLARALYDEAHGAPKTAAEAYVTTLRAARDSDDPDAPLVAWFATHHLLSLRGAVHGLYETHRADLDKLAKSPGHLGWRAVAEISEWSVAEGELHATGANMQMSGAEAEARTASVLGCTRQIRLSGPFGHGSAPDRRRTFAAESPGPWPPIWPVDPERATAPHQLATEGRRCLVSSAEANEPGVFYAETSFDLTTPRDLLIAVQGSLAVFLDGVKISERDLREWGVWQRFGTAVHLEPGRHRLVARLLTDDTSVRLLELDGRPAGIATDTDDSRPFTMEKPTLLADPNPLDRFVRAGKAPSPLDAMLAAYIAHVESLDDVASVLIEPYTTPKDATGVALAAAAQYVRNDPALAADVRGQDERVLEQRAIARDPGLWYPAVWLALDDGSQRGPLESVEPLKLLRSLFPDEPEIAEEGARVYGQLGWKAEHVTLLRKIVEMFPDDIGALHEYLTTLDAEGPMAEADRVAKKIEALDPEAEVTLDRAVARRDWPTAIAELRRLAARHPERKELAVRLADVLERAGNREAAAAAFARVLQRTPDDSDVRLRLADLAYARGDVTSLRKSLAAAIEAGAKSGELREALDLAEGATDLEPYRVDGRKVIAEFEAWEKAHPAAKAKLVDAKAANANGAADANAAKGASAKGNATRILDYSALWVHPDGSSEMLEHEIQRMQSSEAVSQESEQKPPGGTVLHLRVIKPDGTILEPEPVEGKATLTMPHLEVGDCIEMEHVIREPGDGQKGKRYSGPTWFFREADKGYWRSEFVVVTPKEEELEIESRGHVPAPSVKEQGPLVERRWRVDDSPPAPDEPDSVPVTEFLPSVRVGWGVNVEDQVSRLLDVAVDETPLDPRLHAQALEITKGATSDDERARRIYEWIRTNVRDGEETDGRRVVTGKAGARQAAFEHFMRQLGIPVDVAIAKNRLALPPLGPMSDVDSYDSIVLRVRERDSRGGKDPNHERWLTVHDRFSPFGYVPAEIRGALAILLVPGAPRVKLPADGSVDGISFEGRADLKADGSAKVDLVERFDGKIGGTLREVLEKVSEGQLNAFVESRLIARNLPDASLRTLKIEGRSNPDEPLVLRATLDVPALARSLSAGKVALRPLFPAHLSSLATLPSRETPLLLGSASHMETHFTIVVPDGMRLPPSLDQLDIKDADRHALVHDRIEGHALVLDRIVDLPAGRVLPGAPYAAFQQFAQSTDAALEREIVLGQ